ncbi:MAG: hypothetical protein ABJB04_03955 [Betaproteobacteria bacterium]
MRMIRQAALAAGIALTPAVFAAGVIENPQPNSIETGITAITGWNCQANQITIQIDNGPQLVAPYGSLRGDTAQVCGGNTSTGFSYLLNYNTLPIGAHTIRAFADGVMFSTVTFNATNIAGEFLSGKTGEYYLNNFPGYGTRSRVTWQQSKQNFTITGTDAMVAPIDGTFFGGITVTNSGCSDSSNNGSFFEVDKFTVTFGANSALQVTAANSATSCDYAGTAFYTPNGGYITVSNGAFTCTNGLQGTWTSDRMSFDPDGVIANLAIKYTTGETCNAVARFGGARQ